MLAAHNELYMINMFSKSQKIYFVDKDVKTTLYTIASGWSTFH